MKRYNIEFLSSAWKELDDIADYHIQKVGKKSAKRLFDKIMNAIEKLENFPFMAPLIRDEHLSKEGYRILISGEYVCIYRVLKETIYIYHIANGRTEYKNLIID